MNTKRPAVFRQNYPHTGSDCRKQRHQSSPSLHFSSPHSSFSSLLVLMVLLQASSCTGLPSQCYQVPPDPSSCSGPFRPGFYFNATTGRCLGWPNWGCPSNQLFDSMAQCNNTCSISTETDPTPTPTEPTLSPEEICSMGVNNYICDDFEVLSLWVYNSNQKRCHTLLFFSHCLEKQPNMFDTEEDCIQMCGRFSPFYPDSSTPTSTSISTFSSSSSPASPSPSSTPPIIISNTYSSSSTRSNPIPTSVVAPASTSHPQPTTDHPPPTTDHSGSSTTDHSGSSTTDHSGSSPSKPTDGGTETSSELTDDPLTVFDMASIGVGTLIVVLIGVMVIVIASFIHRRRKVLMVLQRHQPAAIKSMSNPCTHQGNGSVVHFVNDDITYSASPTTSSYYV